MKHEQQILQSWHSNAAAWVTTIANEEIESRRLVTNAAIVSAIAACHPQSMLDIGCGEGWLCRRAAATIKGLTRIVGLDAVPDLVAAASAHGVGEYYVKSYQDIIESRYHAGSLFDVAVFNFSLFENERVKDLLVKTQSLVAGQGKLIIQTLHPCTACGDLPYKDGWREGSWNGFSSQFTDPAPWYFRTIEGWLRLLHESGYRIIHLDEPIHPHTGKPASVIFNCQPERS